MRESDDRRLAEGLRTVLTAARKQGGHRRSAIGLGLLTFRYDSLSVCMPQDATDDVPVAANKEQEPMRTSFYEPDSWQSEGC